jgi:hypothetical protein
MLHLSKKIIIAPFLICPLFLSGCSLPNLNVLNFLKSKVGASASVQCGYDDEKGNSVSAFFKDDWFKIDGGTVYKNLPGTVVSKDNKIWIWAKESAEGYIFDMSLDYSQMIIPKKKVAVSPQEFLDNIEFQKQNCNPGLIDNSVFDIPGGVTFINYEEYLQTE